MAKRRLTIGELSRRVGVPVKTLRFWSDEGVLPFAERSAAGYRLYGDEALARLELIRTLREAGVGIDAIRRLLRRDVTLAEVLRLQLGAVEAHIASLQRVAASLRAALRNDHPDDDDIRRISAVTRLTNEERKAIIERFYNRVAEGIAIDEAWLRQMIEASAPKLPEGPTAAQLDAWIELAELVADPTFIDALRANAKEAWQHKVDLAALKRVNDEVAAEAGATRARGLAPTSPEAAAIVERYVAGLAEASQKPLTDAMRRGVRARFANHDPRAARYWELVATMNGTAPRAVGNVDDWRWIAAAVLHHLPQ